MTVTAPAATTYDLGPAVALSCRECGARVALGQNYACAECFGPLEVAYCFGPVTRESIEAGPRSIWRYRDLLPVPAGVADLPGLAPGGTPLVRADVEGSGSGDTVPASLDAVEAALARRG